MTPADRLIALIGQWRTLRVIRHRDGSSLRFEGSSAWVPEGDILRCTEAGRLMQAGQTYEARRVTHWHLKESGIEVSFADGRPFHTINGPDAHHDCPPDDYRLRYDFGAWPLWSVRWHVTGPRKDYRALTRYRRA